MSTDGNNLRETYFRQQKEQEKFQLSKHADAISKFITFAASRGAILTMANISYVQKIGIVATAPGLLEQLTGKFQRERDRLFSFDILEENFISSRSHAGYFQAANFIPMAHPLFRRGMHGMNHFAPCFIDLFWAFERDGVSKYIALEDDRVKLDIDFGYAIEMDTWYGAPYHEDIPKIKNDISKLRPPLDIDTGFSSMFFADTYCLDLKWDQKDEIKTFQALEIKSEKTYLFIDNEKYFPARYIHAEFDLAERRFRHFDGAIQYYSEQEYIQRRDSDFNYNAKHREHIKAPSKKLFKLNGWIDVETWAEFCCQFLAGNPLIHEYFTGKYPNHISEALEKYRAHDSNGQA